MSLRWPRATSSRWAVSSSSVSVLLSATVLEMPAVGEHVELIFHQRDERRDDDGRAGQQHRGQLIAQRLAGAGRQNGERVFAVQHAPDDLFLARLEVLVAEVADAALR